MKRLYPLCLGICALASAAPPATPDFADAHTEVVETLKSFVHVDTMNPPGNETRGAEFLKAILDRAGIPAEIFARDPARGNVIARLKGNGKKRPILLMAHIDTVGVERDKWTVDPLAATICVSAVAFVEIARFVFAFNAHGSTVT